MTVAGMGFMGWGCNKHELPSEKWEFYQANTEGKSKCGCSMVASVAGSCSVSGGSVMKGKNGWGCRWGLEQRIASKIIIKSKHDEQWGGWMAWGKELPLPRAGLGHLWAAEAHSENFSGIFKVLTELKKAQKRSISTAAQPGDGTNTVLCSEPVWLPITWSWYMKLNLVRADTGWCCKLNQFK